MGALFWLRFHDRDDVDKAMRGLKDDLANYKLLVAASFASVTLSQGSQGADHVWPSFLLRGAL